ncbi:MAG TPA: flagellar hook-basal body complex protein, partial [Bacillota bacterium]|nr:flagellar hook-basal body complex protein [Bacillota bacterium]
MMRSMFAGVSGLRNHQTRMDVIGNNIANVNTIGFKSSRVTFQDTLNQTLRGASAPQGSRGGINPLQVGLGMSIATIDILQTQGNLQNTGNISDLAIQGDGFFILSDGSRQYYTRAGNFNLEAGGRLVNPGNGLVVQGWMADSTGKINANGPLTDIQLPLGQTIDPIATTLIEFGGNLDSKTFGSLSYREMTITDNEGNSFRLSFTLTATSNYNEFEYVVSVDNGTITSGSGTATGRIALDLNGNVVAVTGAPFEVTAAGSTTPVTINPP